MDTMEMISKYQKLVERYDDLVKSNENLLKTASLAGDPEDQIIMRREDIKKFKALRQHSLDVLIDIGVTRDYVEKMIHSHGFDIAG